MSIEESAGNILLESNGHINDTNMTFDDYVKKLDELNSRFEILHSSTNQFFLLVIGIIVFFMQAGFAFVEAGAVRTKNTVNILIKNMLDALIGGVAYWAIGFGVAYGPGGNGFIGGSNYFSINMNYDVYPFWFFQYVFAATAATIISGGIAERCQFTAYFVYSVVITGWVYPPVSHWAWDTKTPGFLYEMGYQDFAGSGVVHLLGGCAALVGCICIGPRMGRYTKKGEPKDMPGHSIPLAALGGFILLFGFLAFNGGSQAAIASEGDADNVARAVVNTIMGGCSGGLIVLFANKFLYKEKWSYLMTLNGTLIGMVAQCAGCNVYEPWGSLIIGIIAGLLFLPCHHLMIKLHFDDPVDAVAVHALGGFIGVVCVHIFAAQTGIFWEGGTTEPWRKLGINLLGALIIISWSSFWSFVVFFPLKYFDLLRIDRETEFRGSDLEKHGESAYPASAWVELQYNTKSSSSNLPGNMAGVQDPDAKTDVEYNDPFEMVPTTGMMFKQFSNISSNLSSVQKAREMVEKEKSASNNGYVPDA